MAITQAQLTALEGNIRNLMAGAESSNKIYLEELYNVMRDETSQITDQTYGSPGLMVEWDGAVSYDDITVGYTKQYRPIKYSKGIIIDADVIADKNLARAKPYITNIIDGVHKTLRNETARPFTGAFGTALTGADGAGLCSASHHIVPGDDAQTNYSNLELTYENLNTTLIAMARFKDDRGEEMYVEGDTVICGYYWLDTLKKLFGSDKEAFTADNTINTRSGFKYICHPKILDKSWFVVDSKIMKSGSGLNFWMRRDPRKELQKDETEVEKLKWYMIGRWTLGWTTWHWCYGNQYT